MVHHQHSRPVLLLTSHTMIMPGCTIASLPDASAAHAEPELLASIHGLRHKMQRVAAFEQNSRAGKRKKFGCTELLASIHGLRHKRIRSRVVAALLALD